MRRITINLPDDLDAKLRHEAARRGSTIGEAAKAGRSGSRDTARRIEAIIRQGSR